MEFECPCCSFVGEFNPYGAIQRQNARCPKCGSLERHRLLYLFLKQYIPNGSIRVLHFSPEWMISDLFKRNDIEYIDADFSGRWADRRIDMTDMKFPNDYFDIVLSSDVLEHIPNDIKAMSETYRVLKHDGFAVHL